MKPITKTFSFRKGTAWDGDVEIIHWLEEQLLRDDPEHKGACPVIKQDCQVVITIAK